MKKIVTLAFGVGLTGPMAADTPDLPVTTGAPVSFQAYVTGYSFWDNTPPGTVEISHPVRHRHAGGMGTFSNPLTLAVGHQTIDGEDVLDISPGTLFYLPFLRKYAIVEDTCGDGPSPQDGPCHIGYKGHLWLDIYVDGATSPKAESESCMEKITAIQPVVMDPEPNYSVVVGPITEGGCYVFPNP